VTAISHYPTPLDEPPLQGDLSTATVAPIRHVFKRDALGRLIRKQTDDGVTDYTCDKADNQLSIVFTDKQGPAPQRNQQRRAAAIPP